VNIISLIFILTILPIGVYASIVSYQYSRHTLAILTENGTCTDGTQKKVPPQILNNNGINGSFQKLISDNRELAEIICHNLLNGNATTNMSPKIPDVQVTSNRTLN
jgi:hypothetical protein